jgi:hypothetical protein
MRGLAAKVAVAVNNTASADSVGLFVLTARCEHFFR